MVDWSKVPDVAAVALLTCAFATVARRGHTSMSRPWLTGWIMIVIHFAAFLFSPLPGEGGKFAIFIGLAALTWAGVLFMQAALPYRREPSTGWMLLGLLGAYTFYFGVAMFAPSNITALNAAAACFAVVPISVAVLSVRRINHPLRWILVALHALLADFLLAFQQRPGNGIDLASNAVLFTVYFGCAYRSAGPTARLRPAHLLPSRDSWPGPASSWWPRPCRHFSPPFTWKAKSGISLSMS